MTVFRGMKVHFPVPLSLFRAAYSTSPDPIPAAAQRGCSDALISHTGQHRGQHSRTGPPSLTSLLYTAVLLTRLPALFLKSHHCVCPDLARRFFRLLRKEGAEVERRDGVTLPERGARIRGKGTNTVERIEGGSRGCEDSRQKKLIRSPSVEHCSAD